MTMGNETQRLREEGNWEGAGRPSYALPPGPPALHALLHARLRLPFPPGPGLPSTGLAPGPGFYSHA